MEFQTILNQRARHDKFEELAASETVTNVRNSWTFTLRYDPKTAIEKLRKLSEDQQRDVLRGLSHEERMDVLDKLKCASSVWGIDSTVIAQESVSRVENFPDGFVLDAPKEDPYACSAEPIDPPTSQVNKSGIETITWSRNLSVKSIETMDGRTLYPTPAPSLSMYLLIALFPALGFFVPWAAVRAIGWVGVHC